MIKPELIKARLRELFPKANLSTKRLDELSERLSKKPVDDADQAAIDEVINSANDFMSFDEIAREDDRIRTLETKIARPEPKPPEPALPEPTRENDDTPEWAKALLAKNEKLEADLNALVTGKVTETKLQQARQLFDNSEVFKSIKNDGTKEFFFKQVDANSEKAFEEQIKELETTYSTMVQNTSDEIDHGGTPPQGIADKKPTEAEMDAIIRSATH